MGSDGEGRTGGHLILGYQKSVTTPTGYHADRVGRRTGLGEFESGVSQFRMPTTIMRSTKAAS